MMYLLVAGNMKSFAPVQQVEVTEPKIQKVTVFLSGAQISREGNFLIQPGVNEITFSGVSPYVDPNSLQARGFGEFTIMDVKFKVHYPQPEKVENDPNKIPADVLKKMNLLRDSLDVLNYNLEELRAKKEVRTMERQMLLNNGTVKGTGKVNDSIQLLKSAMEFFHAKMTEINLDLFQMKKKEDKMVQQQTEMLARLADLENWKYKNNLTEDPKKGPVYQIVVTVNTDKAVKGKLEIGYMVSQAGWAPSYDLRAKDANSPVELNYKAQVYQNTGEEWEKVNLTLSSNNPYINQSKPVLNPMYITYYNPYAYRNDDKAKYYDEDLKKDMEAERKELSQSATGAMQEKLNDGPIANNAMNYITQRENMVSAEFEIKLPYSIKSNNEPHFVSLGKENLTANYILNIVPKLDKNAFLVANITNWEDLNLLPARANIYYDGTYVGQSYLDPTAMEDTLRLAMGRDNSVSAVRKKLKDKEKEKIIGDNKIKDVAYEIVIRNAHGYALDIIVEDQVPVSNLQDVKVEVLDKGKAEMNDYSGILTWRMKMKPGASEKIGFAYTVKYDKNKNLSMAW